jgi:hypothetical protein
MAAKRPLAELKEELRSCRARLSSLEMELSYHPDRLRKKLGLPPLLALLDNGTLTRWDSELVYDESTYDTTGGEGEGYIEYDLWKLRINFQKDFVYLQATKRAGEPSWVLDQGGDSDRTVWHGCEMVHDAKKNEIVEESATLPAFRYPYRWQRIWPVFLERNQQHVGRALAGLSFWCLEHMDKARPSVLQTDSTLLDALWEEKEEERIEKLVHNDPKFLEAVREDEERRKPK